MITAKSMSSGALVTLTHWAKCEHSPSHIILGIKSSILLQYDGYIKSVIRAPMLIQCIGYIGSLDASISSLLETIVACDFVTLPYPSYCKLLHVLFLFMATKWLVSCLLPPWFYICWHNFWVQPFNIEVLESKRLDTVVWPLASCVM